MKSRKRIELAVIWLVVAGTCALLGIRLRQQRLQQQFINAMSVDDAATVIALMDSGVDPRKRQPTGVAPIALACSRNAKRTLAALLKRGERPGSDDIGMPATHDDPEMVQTLLKAGASPNAKVRGIIPLMLFLADSRQPGMMKLLLAAGADPNVASPVPWYKSLGCTPLMTSASLGDTEAMKPLIKAGARIDAQVADPHSGQDGFTALMFAVSFGQAPAAKLLLEAGARTDISSADGTTPAAKARGNPELVKLLKQYAGHRNMLSRNSTNGR